MADGDPVQIRRWAQAHAATVSGAAPASGPAAPAAAVAGSREPVTTVLTGLTELRTWESPAAGCNGLAWGWHPGGQLLLATADGDGTARIWDAATGELRQGLRANARGIADVAWAAGPDGRPLLAAGSFDTTARIWDIGTGQCLSTLTGHDDRVDSIAWGHMPDGYLRVVTTSLDRTARIWDPGTGETLHVLRGHSDPVTSADWTRRSDGQALLATGSLDSTVRIWDPGTGQVLHTLSASRAVYTVAWTGRPDGRLLLAAACPAGTVGVWTEDGDGFTSEVLDVGDDRAWGVAWLPLADGRLLLAVSTMDTLQIWDGVTRRRLHSMPLSFQGAGYKNTGWAVAPDGRVLLAANSEGGRVHVWEALPDPPAQPPHVPPGLPQTEPGRETAPGQAATRPARPGRRGVILDPPEDVTPRFEADGDPAGPDPGADHVRCASRADGHVLLAAADTAPVLGGMPDQPPRIWDATTGALLHVLPVSGDDSLAWGHLPDGRLLLTTTGRPTPEVSIWDPGTGQLAYRYPAEHTTQSSWERQTTDSVAWIHDQDGRPLLATGGTSDGNAHLRDPETGRVIRTLGGHGHYVQAIAEGRLADGQRRLVTGSWHEPARIWDPGTGEQIRELTVPADDPRANHMWAAAWGHGPGGRPEVAIGTADGAIRIWDPETGHLLRTLTGHTDIVYSLAWASQPGWPPLLASGGGDGTARIWDPHTGAELHRLPSPSSRTQAIDLARSPDGDLLLVIASGGNPGEPASGPARIWRIATGPADTAGPDARPPGRLTPQRAGELAGWLLRLGSGGLWPPAGLVADLVALTGLQGPPSPDSPPPDPAASDPAASDPAASDPVPPEPPARSRPLPAALNDARLAALDGEAGLTRLRHLGWPPAARVAFAALLASSLAIPERYAPSAGGGPGQPHQPASLREELAGALTGGPGVSAETPAGLARIGTGPWRAPIAGLRTAAAGITGQVIALLAVLGPDACAADPILPLRLAHHIPAFPVLSPRELRLLTAPGARSAAGAMASAEATAWSPGTAGVARDGPLTRLLPTQLALPRDLLTTRLAENQLLYRQHRAPAPPAPEPVTIILDTTPPTFGPAGNALRLAAHLITATLRDHGRYPALVTLTEPDAITDLRAPADLVRIWTPVSLDHPGDRLAAALRTAAGAGRPVVFCTHFQTARDAGYRPGPGSRLLTAHQPPERPPAGPASPWHAHLPPRPGQAQLAAAVGMLLAAAPGQRPG